MNARHTISYRLISAITLPATLLPALFFSFGCGNAGASEARAAIAPEPIRVASEAATSRVLPGTLAVTGALFADESADVAAERDGRVARVNVERGSFVEKGAVLAVLDEREAKASLDEARASLDWAKSERARYEELRSKNVVSSSEKQRKEIDLSLASARLELAQKSYEDCVIRAPFAGVVAERKISSGAFVQRGQAVASLVKVDPLRAELAVPESAVSAVKEGQVVSLTVQSFPDRVFPGKIAWIGPSLKSEARTLVVEARVPNKGRLLRPGLFTTASIELPKTAPAVLVPEAAVVTEAGISRVFVLGSSRVAERLVSLGTSPLPGLVEVRSGVNAGERVALHPDRRLADGLEIVR